jgi:hypothetical protein
MPWDGDLSAAVAFYCAQRQRKHFATVAEIPLSYRSQREIGSLSSGFEESDMAHMILAFFSGSEDVFRSLGLWAFLSIGAIALFAVFIPLVTYIDRRGKEREAYYKAESLRRIAEAHGEGARMAMDMFREENRQKQIKMIEGLKIGGLINFGVGVALVIFLRVLLGGGSGSPYLCGLFPAMVGVAMLVYVFFLARPVE